MAKHSTGGFGGDGPAAFDFPSLLLELQRVVVFENLDLATQFSLALTSNHFFELINPKLHSNNFMTKLSKSLGEGGYWELLDEFYEIYTGLSDRLIIFQAVIFSRPMFLVRFAIDIDGFKVIFRKESLDFDFNMELSDLAIAVGQSGDMKMIHFFKSVGVEFQLAQICIGAAGQERHEMMEALMFEENGDMALGIRDLRLVMILLNACFLCGRLSSLRWIEGRDYLTIKYDFISTNSTRCYISVSQPNAPQIPPSTLKLDAALSRVPAKSLLPFLRYFDQKEISYSSLDLFDQLRRSHSGELLRLFLSRHRQAVLDHIEDELPRFSYSCVLISNSADEVDWVVALLEAYPSILDADLAPKLFHYPIRSLNLVTDVEPHLRKFLELQKLVVSLGFPMPPKTLEIILKKVRKLKQIDFSEIILFAIQSGAEISYETLFQFLEGRKCSKREEILTLVSALKPPTSTQPQ